MFTFGQFLSFTFDHSESCNDFLSRFGWIDHRIDNATFSRYVGIRVLLGVIVDKFSFCLLYTSDAADE